MINRFLIIFQIDKTWNSFSIGFVGPGIHGEVQGTSDLRDKSLLVKPYQGEHLWQGLWLTLEYYATNNNHQPFIDSLSPLEKHPTKTGFSKSTVHKCNDN